MCRARRCNLNVGESATLGRQAIALDAYNAFGLNHYGGRGAIQTYSLVDVIEGKVPSRTDRRPR